MERTEPKSVEGMLAADELDEKGVAEEKEVEKLGGQMRHHE